MAEPHEETLRDLGRWAWWVALASAALQTAFARQPELSPRQVAEVVADALPARVGGWLLVRLRRLDLLRPEVQPPVDLFDRPDRPAGVTPRRIELLRLAVFGLPGQGLSSRDKRRDGLYQQLCAEIMRSAVDSHSLKTVATRVLNHPEVVSDAQLLSQMRAFIAQREVALRVARETPAEQYRRQSESSKLRQAFDVPQRSDFPTRSDVLASFRRLMSEFDAAVAQFEEQRAEQVLRKMDELRLRFPVHVPTAELQRTEEQFDRFRKRAGTYRRQIRDLAAQARAAAGEGDHKTATWVIRRLHAIHALLPTLLPAAILDELQGEIDESGHQHEMREALQELRQREQSVVVRIKDLAGVIHRFHEITTRQPRDEAACQRAAVNYQRAVAEIREMDTDWLAGLILELETLLEDLDDPAGQMQNKLDQFIRSVRSALNRLRCEVRSIQAGIRRPASPPPESGPTSED